MLFLRVHVTFGVGLPEAEHSILTDDPFLTCKCPPELMWWILGGTEKKNWNEREFGRYNKAQQQQKKKVGVYLGIPLAFTIC